MKKQYTDAELNAAYNNGHAKGFELGIIIGSLVIAVFSFLFIILIK